MMTKYYLYFASPVTGTGLDPRRIGATFAHLTIWAIAYSICYKGDGNAMLVGIGIVTVLVGFLTLPLLGFAGLIILYLVYRGLRGASAERDVTGLGDRQRADHADGNSSRQDRAGQPSRGHIGSTSVAPGEWSGDQSER